MQQLSATDAIFLYSEMPSSPVHTASAQAMALPIGIGARALTASPKAFIAEYAHCAGRPTSPTDRRHSNSKIQTKFKKNVAMHNNRLHNAPLVRCSKEGARTAAL